MNRKQRERLAIIAASALVLWGFDAPPEGRTLSERAKRLRQRRGQDDAGEDEARADEKDR